MNELQVFENEEFGTIRMITIDNEAWFVGKDVAEALGFVNPRDAIATHVFLEDKGVEIIDTLGGKPLFWWRLWFWYSLVVKKKKLFLCLLMLLM